MQKMKKYFISIIIPTLGRESLYPLVKNLLKQKFLFNYEIILIVQAPLTLPSLKDERIKIIHRSVGKGIAYYRNEGVKISHGDILVFIDDDEFPINNYWLTTITKPIIKDKEQVITSGIKIKLDQGYLADSISLAGFPGGGAVGFEVMWVVNNKGYTKHICTGNMAIKKSVLALVGNFENSLTHGGEDVLLADRIIAHHINIKYEKKATIYHVARKSFINFIQWNIKRGKALYQFKQLNKKIYSYLPNRIMSLIMVLKKTVNTKYFFMVVFILANQYFWMIIGYLTQNFKSIIKKLIYETNS